MKRLLALLLCFALCFSLLPAAFAEDIEIVDPEVEASDIRLIDDPAPAEEPTLVDGAAIHVNPLYRGLISEEELAAELRTAEPAEPAVSCKTLAQAAAALRSGMKARQSTVTIDYTGSESFDVYTVMDMALAHTGKPTEGDYIAFQYGGWSFSSNTYRISYYTTAAQETEMDSAVTTLLNQLALNGKSDYQKTKAIYDYVCGHVSYDNAHVGNSSYKLQFTAYAALINGTAVCQGYANLMYRLLLSVGVDTRIVTSTNHAWNIVGLGDYYYNVDSTWDAGSVGSYSWFLKCMAHFPGHEREEPYCEDPFLIAYPMSPADYAQGSSPIRLNSDMLTLYVGGSAGSVSYTIDSGTSYSYIGWSYPGDGIVSVSVANSAVTITPQKAGSGVVSLKLLDANRAVIAKADVCVTVLAQKPGTPYLSKNTLKLPMPDQTVLRFYRSDGSPTDAIWASSDASIASVDGAGVVTAHKYGKCTITATADGKYLRCSVQTLFSDVTSTGKYYYEPVYWAADKGITVGYSDGSFGVGKDCQRRELMIFLWRYAGCPGKGSSVSSYGDARTMFNDLSSYSPSTATNQAIAWAVKTGITKGYSDGGFHPTAPIVRKDVMIMLYRLAGKPAVSGTLSFPDCQKYNPTSDTYKAILWGSQNGITKGYSSGEYAGQFGVSLNCLREQIVTFLYRYAEKYS